jgi:hypothetical protein
MSAKSEILREVLSAAQEAYTITDKSAHFHEVNAVACGLLENKETGEWAFLVKLDGTHFIFRHDIAQLKAFAEEVFTSIMRLEELQKHASSS